MRTSEQTVLAGLESPKESILHIVPLNKILFPTTYKPRYGEIELHSRK